MQNKIPESDPIRQATIGAVKHLVDPLMELLFDTGVTVKELTQLLRDRAVRVASQRVIDDCGRNSKSRVAILTGLPRSEVTRILGSADIPTRSWQGQHPARKVLAAWYDNPRFLAPSGEPAVLPIFGRRRSFEHLVTRYGAGIPVRAMLDELTQIDAIERLADQKVRAKSRVPILTGLTTSAISAMGERCRDLIRTLTTNVRRQSPPLFEAAALVSDADSDLLPVMRRELTEQGVSFVNAASSLLKRSRRKTTGTAVKTKFRVGVAAFYFEEKISTPASDGHNRTQQRRKNLQRHSQLVKETVANNRRQSQEGQ